MCSLEARGEDTQELLIAIFSYFMELNIFLTQELEKTRTYKEQEEEEEIECVETE